MRERFSRAEIKGAEVSGDIMGRHAVLEQDTPTVVLRVAEPGAGPAAEGPFRRWVREAPTAVLLPMVGAAVIFGLVLLGTMVNLVVSTGSDRSTTTASSQVNDYDQTYGGVSNLSAHEVLYFKALDSVGVYEWRQDQADYVSDIYESCSQLNEGAMPGSVMIERQQAHGWTINEANAIVTAAVFVDCPQYKQQILTRSGWSEPAHAS